MTLLLLALGCGDGPRVDVTGDPPDRLSRLGLLTLEDGEITYADGVLPYDLNTPLFSDHAIKDRALWLPEGEAARFDPEEAFDLPVGTAIVKSFAFAPDLRAPDVDPWWVETRLLVRTADGWEGWPYVWRDDQTDADLAVGGAGAAVSVVDETGAALAFEYRVPQKNQCQQCHLRTGADGDAIVPIGIKARHLSRDHDYDGVAVDQLEHLAALGQLTGLPDEVPAAFDFREVVRRGVDDLTDEEATSAARDWLDINCAHCHDPRGVSGVTTQLFLDHATTDPFHLGVCKLPGSAGPGGVDRTFDVVPGDHAASILWYRMTTTEVGAMMPQIGRATALPIASDLVARWIDGLEGSCE